MCVYGRAAGRLGACGDAEPRRCGQRHLGGANADQKDSLGPLACGDPDRKAGDRGRRRQHVVDSRVGRDRDRSPGARCLHREPQEQRPDCEAGDGSRLAEPEHERRCHDRRRGDQLDRGVGAIRDGS